MSKPPKRRRSRWVRLLRAAIGTAVGVALAYVVAINVFLSTSLFGRVVNGNPETLDVHYTHCWSIVPWRIHAQNLSIRGRDSNVEWMLRIDDVEFAVSFWSLAQKRFEASHVRGRGVTYRLRQRLDRPPTSPQDWAGLPPIEGLPPYGVRPPPEPSPEDWSDAAYHLWTVHLEDVISEDTREVWVDRLRFAGSARVTGRFYLKPIRSVEVGPVNVRVAHGGVSLERGPVADRLDGSKLTVTVARFDPRTVGSDLIHHVSADVDARAEVPDVSQLPLPVLEGVTVRGAARVDRAVARVRSGVLQSDSHLLMEALAVNVDSKAHRVTATATLKADVERGPPGEHDRLAFAAQLTDVDLFQRISAHVAAHAFLHVRRVDVDGDAGVLDLQRFLADLHLAVEMPDAQLEIARALTRYIPHTASIAIENGRATVGAHVDVWPGEQRVSGRVMLHADDLGLRLAKLRIRGRTSARAQFDSFDLAARGLHQPKLTLDIEEGTLSSQDAPGEALVRIRGARLVARGWQVNVDDPLRELEVTISVPDGRIVARRLLHAYLPKGETTQLATGHARFTLYGKLTLVAHRARGTLDLRSEDLLVERGRLRLGAGVRVHARVHDWRWQTGDLVVDDARVSIEHPTVTSADTKGPMLALDRIVLAAESNAFTFSDPLARVGFRAALVNARVHDPAALNAFLPEKAAYALEGQDAAFDADVRVDVKNHVASGEVSANASGLGVGNRSLHLRGDVALAARVDSWDLGANTLALRAARIRLEHVTGRFRPNGTPELSARRLALEVSSPELHIDGPTLVGSDFHLVLEEAEIPDVRAVAALLPPGAAFGIEGGRARADADLWVSNSKRTSGGTVRVALTGAAMRLGETRLSGDFDFRAQFGGFDPERREIALAAARLGIRDLTVTGATATAADWDGSVDVTNATLGLRPALRFDGLVRIEARDARPLLALVFGKRVSPFVVGLADMPHLVASSQVKLGMDRLALVDFDARGGNVALRGSYAKRGAHQEGGVVGRKWFVSAGFGVNDGGTWVRLFGLDGWLRDRRREVQKLLDAK